MGAERASQASEAGGPSFLRDSEVPSLLTKVAWQETQKWPARPLAEFWFKRKNKILTWQILKLAVLCQPPKHFSTWQPMKPGKHRPEEPTRCPGGTCLRSSPFSSQLHKAQQEPQAHHCSPTRDAPSPCAQALGQAPGFQAWFHPSLAL